MNRPMFHNPIRLLVAAAFVAATGVAFAQTQARDVQPLPGESRVTITMGTRAVAFPTKIAPLVRETIPFEAGGHAVTEEGRQSVARLQDGLLRQPGSSLIIVVFGENEALAFQRARAVRGELAERHSMDAARIVATGRAAAGHTGDLAVVDVYSADATRCGGCGTSTFRSIALDSAAMALVTSMAEALPASSTTTAAANPSPSARPATITAAARPSVAPIAPPAQRLQAAEPPRPAAPAPRVQGANQPKAVALTGTSCARPRIIIDDYYPGGPIVPCRPGR